ncbi:MAG: 5-oxoprolinase subunit PxpB [Burkholderiaceae bacterium]
MTASLRIHPLGDRALLCETGGVASLDTQRRIWALARQACDWTDVAEAVPGVNNLLLVFDALSADADALRSRVERAWSGLRVVDAEPGPLIEIPVVYGGGGGPDLDDVARHAGMLPEEVIERHAGAEYTVFCMGFQPGFAYLGGLDPRLATPRRATPRTDVPAGSVAIGGPQTTIYPARSPGGWNLIGRSDAVLFAPDREPPSLMAAGYRVRFVPVDSLGPPAGPGGPDPRSAP